MTILREVAGDSNYWKYSIDWNQSMRFCEVYSSQLGGLADKVLEEVKDGEAEMGIALLLLEEGRRHYYYYSVGTASFDLLQQWNLVAQQNLEIMVRKAFDLGFL